MTKATMTKKISPKTAKTEQPLRIKTENGEVVAICDPVQDGLEVIRSAAYVLTDRAFALLEEGPKDCVRVVLQPKEPAEEAGLKALARTFEDELATQRIRHQISKNNVSIREYIVEQAILLAQQPAQPPPPQAPPEPELSAEQRKEIERLIAEVEEEIRQQAPARASQDPLKISATWEETHGKTGKP